MQVLEDDLDPNEVPKKLLTLEDRSRCNNLRFDSITEDTNKAWDDCEWKVQEFVFNNLNIEGNIKIDQCHCFEKFIGSRLRTIVCRFLRFKDKQKVLHIYTYTYMYIIWVAVSCVWVRVELMVWQLNRLEHTNRVQWTWVQIPLRETFYSYFKKSFSQW